MNHYLALCYNSLQKGALKFMRIAAIIVTAFWMLSLVFYAFTIHTISGEAGRYIMQMATISVFGMAILETLKKAKLS
jgi:hypothetical protein